MAILVMYISGFFFCMMPVVILSWLGEQIDVGSVSTVARILLFGYAYYLLSDIASVVVLGMGHPEYLMRASVLKLLIVIALNVILIPNMGVIGAALAMTISEIIGTVYFVVPCHRELHRSYLGVIAQIYAWPIITSIFASLSTFVVYKLVYSFLFVPQGRLQNIGMILVTGIIFTSLYGLTLLKSAYIDTYDKGLFSQYLQKSIQYCGVLKRRKPLDASYPE